MTRQADDHGTTFLQRLLAEVSQERHEARSEASLGPEFEPDTSEAEVDAYLAANGFDLAALERQRAQNLAFLKQWKPPAAPGVNKPDVVQTVVEFSRVLLDQVNQLFWSRPTPMAAIGMRHGAPTTGKPTPETVLTQQLTEQGSTFVPVNWSDEGASRSTLSLLYLSQTLAWPKPMPQIQVVLDGQPVSSDDQEPLPEDRLLHLYLPVPVAGRRLDGCRIEAVDGRLLIALTSARRA